MTHPLDTLNALIPCLRDSQSPITSALFDAYKALPREYRAVARPYFVARSTDVRTYVDARGLATDSLLDLATKHGLIEWHDAPMSAVDRAAFIRRFVRKRSAYVFALPLVHGAHLLANIRAGGFDFTALGGVRHATAPYERALALARELDDVARVAGAPWCGLRALLRDILAR